MTDALHGDVEQKQRERILKKFKAKKTKILVATDVAARGIDVNDLTHVVNYHIPQDPESYTHRVGRTGRAGKQGIAITMITPSEWRKLSYIQRVTKTDIKKGQLPSIDSVLEAKVANIKQRIETVSHANFEQYEALTTDLMEKHEPSVLVSTLLKIAFADQVEAASYRDIQTVSRQRVNNSGKTRLFIARGKSHGLDVRGLVEMLKEECDIEDKHIDDVRVLEEFSFVTCPFEEAELIIDIFKRKPGRNIVSKAKENGSG